MVYFPDVVGRRHLNLHIDILDLCHFDRKDQKGWSGTSGILQKPCHFEFYVSVIKDVNAK